MKDFWSICRRGLWVLCLLSVGARARLNVVKVDSPRDTMQSFMAAMQDYKYGIEHNDAKLKGRIDDAVRTLDLSDAPALLRNEKGREAAIFLKEVIDRVVIINYDKIPVVSPAPAAPLLRWRLEGTEITIFLLGEGPHAGEYLFHPSTVANARVFFDQVAADPYLPGSGGGAAYTEPWLEKAAPEWLQDKVLGFAKWQWLGLLVSIFLGFLVKLFSTFLLAIVSFFASRTKTTWDDHALKAIQKPFSWVVLGAFWIFSVYALGFEGLPFEIMKIFGQVLVSGGLIWIFYRLCDVFIDFFQSWMARVGVRIDEQLVPLLQSTLKTLVAVLGILIAVQNLGINVASLIAGLGLGGLAFALAAKDTAANVFGSVTILLDRPFKIGDLIKVGDQEGVVEQIGFRSTRIRTLYNSQISLPNAVVANANIDNLGRRKFRRVNTRLGLTYDTSPEKMRRFTQGIKEILIAHPKVKNDTFHVYFNDYGSSDLQVMLYFFLDVCDWSEELKEREAVLLSIYDLAEKLEVSFAFPTQTVLLHNAEN